MLEHGGRLRMAAEKYGIPLEDLLDLSTGINPNGWPVPCIPAECWQRLPEDNDELLDAAQTYYKNLSLLPVAGSQAAIQTLPQLRPACRVGVMHPAYAEHAVSWQKNGHNVRVIDDNSIDSQLHQLDVVILINPNNPTGKLWEPKTLLAWHAKLRKHDGWLIVDEAFIDSTPELSLSEHPTRPGLIVLRSIGKFFGLAGIRCGAVLAEAELLEALKEKLGPWTIGHPSRYVAARALQDRVWQQETALTLKQQSRQLEELLKASGWPPQGGCDLFQWIKTKSAPALHELLAHQGILTRLFQEPDSLRFGLPKAQADWDRLKKALAKSDIKRLRQGMH